MDIYQNLARAMEDMHRGELAEAEARCRSILAIFPKHTLATALLGDVLMRAGKRMEALESYERAIQIQPDNARLFTATATMRFRSVFGMPKPPRPPVPGGPRIQMTKLGSDGRFGNQLLQYAFVTLYAQEHGLAAEFPDWIGRDLFDRDDPFPSGKLTAVDEKDTDLFASLNRRSKRIFFETDISGYFCGDTRQWGARAKAFCALFVPGKTVAPLLQRALERLRSSGKTVVAIHLRHTDFGYGQFWTAPASWYVRWLHAVWPKLDNPVLYVATEGGKFLAEFAEFSPWDAGNLGVDIPGAGFLVDHHILRNADYLAISNSTFSFSAAMLNERALGCVRPDPDRRELVAFDPWAAPVLLQPSVETNEKACAERVLIERLFSADHSVLHLGRYCAPWTNLARSTNHNMRIHEADPQVPVDRWRRENDIRHLRHLVVEDAGRLPDIVIGAAATLRHARIDMFHFRLADGQTAAEIAGKLTQNGYVFFRQSETAAPDLVPLGGPSRPGRYVAIQERLLQPSSGPKLESLDIPALCRKHGIKVRGVVHVGAHEGREIAQYDAMRAERVLFVEANPVVYVRLAAAMRERDDVMTVQRAISDRAGRMQLHLASFDQSSSLLPMARHLEIYPQIVPAGTVEVEATPLDALIRDLALPYDRFNLLNIDVQGAEAMVLRGASETLRNIEAINIEVNFAELYSGGAEIEEIDQLLSAAGFRRVATISPFHPDWGDAFYVRGS